MPCLLLALFLGVAWTAQAHADRTPSGARWLGGPALVCAVLAALLAWQSRGLGDPAALEALYTGLLVPGLLLTAASTALPLSLIGGWSRAAAGLLGAGAVVAAVGARLDARVLQLAVSIGEPGTRHWFVERLAGTWAYRGTADLVALGLVAGALVCLRPRGWPLMATLIVSALSASAAVALDGAWDRLRDPGAVQWLAEQPLPVMEAAAHEGTVSAAAIEQGVLLAAPPGQRLQDTALSPARAILVMLPGTESLPPGLRWVGWRAIPVAQDARGGSLVFGGRRQIWLQTEDQVQSLGTIAEASERLTGSASPVQVRPGLDWRLGDLAALCASSGCAVQALGAPSGGVEVRLQDRSAGLDPGRDDLL